MPAGWQKIEFMPLAERVNIHQQVRELNGLRLSCWGSVLLALFYIFATAKLLDFSHLSNMLPVPIQ
jgi:hypothetical protein